MPASLDEELAPLDLAHVAPRAPAQPLQGLLGELPVVHDAHDMANSTPFPLQRVSSPTATGSAEMAHPGPLNLSFSNMWRELVIDSILAESCVRITSACPMKRQKRVEGSSSDHHLSSPATLQLESKGPVTHNNSESALRAPTEGSKPVSLFPISAPSILPNAVNDDDHHHHHQSLRLQSFCDPSDVVDMYELLGVPSPALCHEPSTLLASSSSPNELFALEGRRSVRQARRMSLPAAALDPLFETVAHVTKDEDDDHPSLNDSETMPRADYTTRKYPVGAISSSSAAKYAGGPPVTLADLPENELVYQDIVVDDDLTITLPSPIDTSFAHQAVTRGPASARPALSRDVKLRTKRQFSLPDRGTPFIIPILKHWGPSLDNSEDGHDLPSLVGDLEGETPTALQHCEIDDLPLIPNGFAQFRQPDGKEEGDEGSLDWRNRRILDWQREAQNQTTPQQYANHLVPTNKVGGPNPLDAYRVMVPDFRAIYKSRLEHNLNNSHRIGSGGSNGSPQYQSGPTTHGTPAHLRKGSYTHSGPKPNGGLISRVPAPAPPPPTLVFIGCQLEPGVRYGPTPQSPLVRTPAIPAGDHAPGALPFL
ncbi:hypothetical protein BJ085DRAFT_33805 [Dimargaris cristalligena]|uniref:Uncharacterized protein n=1 Tax=Dimargaris cristalligena TaxID=215637 RepID=A0A4P9ZMD2_9FUNG|nr:hypothetical protein BJ085DRAFT_33805 [Dimargaris cristalligena]|eukprot:RKP34526.1 hypothetical protein BJ085DRAFT_33805 [Dimargaris cristalligena]